MSVSSDEINFLVYRYLQENGFVHAAFTFAYESDITRSSVANADIPPGTLITYIQKGLQLVGLQAHVNEDGTERECNAELTLLNPHICQIAQSTSGNYRNSLSKSGKRKRKNHSTSQNEEIITQTVSYTPTNKDKMKITNNKNKDNIKDNNKDNNKDNSKDNHKDKHKEKNNKDIDKDKEKENEIEIEIEKDIGNEKDKENKYDNKLLSSSQENDSISNVDTSYLTLVGHRNEVFICSWNPTQNQIASGSGDSTARLWDIPDDILQNMTNKTLEATYVLPHTTSKQNNKDVTTIEWNNDGSLLATGSYDGQTRLWTNKGELKHKMDCHNGPVFSLKWNKSNNLLLSASYDKSIGLFDPNTGINKKKVSLHSAPILDTSWQNDHCFATCSSDKTIKICSFNDLDNDTINHIDFETFYGHADEVNTIKWNGSSTLLASCSDDYTVKLWDPTRKKNESHINDMSDSMIPSNSLVYDLKDHKKEVYTIRWSPTGPGTDNPNKNISLASASFDTTIKLWDVETGICSNTLTHTDPVYAIGFSPNGDYLASGALNGVIHIWSMKNYSIIKTFCGKGDIYEMEWNHRGDMITACFSSGSLMVINFRS